MEDTPDVNAQHTPAGGLPAQLTGKAGLGLGGGALAMLVAAYGYLETNFSTASQQREDIRSELRRIDYTSSTARREIEVRIERLEERVKSLAHDAGDDRWRGTEMRLWALRLAQQNPALVVPEVDPR